MKMLLTSAGMYVKEEIIKILSKPPNQLKIAHIITASKPEKDIGFIESYRPLIEKAIATTKYPVVALSDTQAVLVEENKYKIVGTGNRVFYNGFEELFNAEDY